MKQQHYRRWLVVAVAIALLMTHLGCTDLGTKQVRVTKQMTWECAPDEYKPAFPARADEYVRFRFVEEPRCFDVESQNNFCSELRATAKRVVSVQFEVWGGWGPFAREGYNIVAVEGRRLGPGKGWAHNGSNDFDGRCPIGKVIDGLR